VIGTRVEEEVASTHLTLQRLHVVALGIRIMMRGDVQVHHDDR
jgi:hypothetical protein